MDDKGTDSENAEETYEFSKVLTNADIKLSAWSQNGRRELLALFMGNGEFAYYYLTEDHVVMKQIPWLADVVHNPVSMIFSPSGSYLLVISQRCHIYILPAISVVDSNLSNDQAFDLTDITIHAYPFPTKPHPKPKPTKSTNSSLSVKSAISRQSSNSSVSSSEINKCMSSRSSSSSSSSQHGDSKTVENLAKLKEMRHAAGSADITATAVAWWQTLQDCLQIAVIGTQSGVVLFVNLNTGIKIGETSVRGGIKRLIICQDNSLDTVYLMITTENMEQYRLMLEQRQACYIWPGRHHCGSTSDDGEVTDGGSQGSGAKGNYLPAARARLQGLKQLSVEKLATLKQKIAETRSKAKSGADGASNKLNGTPRPENLASLVGDTVISHHFSRARHVLAGYYAPTQLLTIHSMSLEVNPLFIHKLPADTDQLLLCNQVVFVVSKSGCCIQVVSCHLSETRMESDSDFNPDSVLGKWELKAVDGECSTVGDQTGLAKPDVIPHNLQEGCSERVLNLYKSQRKGVSFDVTQEYKLEGNAKEIPESPGHENCVVVTNKGVYMIQLRGDVVQMALDLILRAQELEKAERMCKIFGVNLQLLLEIAGDVKLAAREFPKAIALYKLSKCGPLKSIVKLSCGGHCSQVLSYSSLLLTNNIADMSLTERIHLSNLVLMAYTQQILKTEHHKGLMDKFLEFLEQNIYYDEILAVSVTGQSLLFPALHKLVTYKGLILDGFNIVIKLMQKFSMTLKSHQWTFDHHQFWLCATEPCLIEAMIYRGVSLHVFMEHVVHALDTLEPEVLSRLLHLTDPTSPYLRSVTKVSKAVDDTNADNSTFPFHKLVELFLLCLAAYLKKTGGEQTYRKHLVLPTEGSDEPNYNIPEDVGASRESLVDQHIWPIRKDMQGGRHDSRVGNCLSSGFGHSALIRNGSVYTWGETSKGRLGHGPTMARHSTPMPISWFGCFRLEVSSVSCGHQHTLALTNNGVYSWGGSAYGQLGLGDVFESPHPRLVLALANENITAVSCGQYHSLALTNQGSVFAWGWGVHGQLGLGSVEDQRTPVLIHTLKEHVVVEVAGGHGHSMVLTEKGHVYGFGSSVFGQLGTGNTTKSSVPVLVKGMKGGRVSMIATGYFHTLALTESNLLYTWGTSSQSLRLQAQAHKRSRLLQSQNLNTGSSDPDADPEPSIGSDTNQELPDADKNGEKNESEAHLSPSVVDLRNISEKIIQIATGYHHSALLTSSGQVYTWGRSLNGQLGHGARRETPLPTLLIACTIRADAIACGCSFTTLQEIQNGRIFAWGNNSVGQLGLPVKDSATKALDGKLIILKSCKRSVRIPHSGPNSVDTPHKVPDIPSSAFSYHTLSKHNMSRTVTLGAGRATHEGLHHLLDKYLPLLNTELLLNKCLDFGNYQAASKIALLQNKLKQSMIYQLKALQNTPKYRDKCHACPILHEDGTKTPKSELATPDSEIHLFTIQGGHEQMCDESQSQDVSQCDDELPDQKVALSSGKTYIEDIEAHRMEKELRSEYIELVIFIIDTYLTMPLSKGQEVVVLETAIQFWIAEKLPMTCLEGLFLERIALVFFDIGYLLFCQDKKENHVPLLQYFSTKFLMRVTSKMLDHIEQNGSCIEYLETMSKMMLTDDKPKQTNRNSRECALQAVEETRPERVIQVLTEKLRRPQAMEHMLNVPYADLVSGKTLFFSCGHGFSAQEFEDQLEGDSKLGNMYGELNENSRVDLACPQCLRHCL